MRCQKQYQKTSKKVRKETLFSVVTSPWFLSQMEVLNALSIYLLKSKKKCIFDMNVLFSVKVFLIFVGKDRYFILQQENIRRYCIHLYDKYKEFN